MSDSNQTPSVSSKSEQPVIVKTAPAAETAKIVNQPTAASVVKEQVEQAKTKDLTPSGSTVRPPQAPQMVNPIPAKSDPKGIEQVAKETIPVPSNSDTPNYNSRAGLRG